MLTIRRTTPRRVALPSALTALETTTALGIAHVAAGGETPEISWLAAFGVLVYGASAVVLRRRTTIRAALPLLLAAQVLGHAWLVALTGAGHAHAHTEPGPVLGLSVPMVVAHLVAAVVTGVAWMLRRRAVAVLLRWTDGHRPLPPAPTSTLGATRRHEPTDQHLTVLRPTRGPPAALVPC